MIEAAPLLQLLRLGSAALPIGAFAYSQGVEPAVARGIVHDAESTLAWLSGVFRHALATTDLPIVLRLYDAWAADDAERALRWNDELFATRGSRELREEDVQLGRALARLLSDLGHERATAFRRAPRLTLAAMVALAAAEHGTGARAAALTYGFAWFETQVAAATRLVPLGQTEAQRVLSGALAALAAALPAIEALRDDELTSTTPGQVLFSMQHETQYTRLFRS